MAQELSHGELQDRIQALSQELETLENNSNINGTNQYHLEAILNNTNAPIFLKTVEFEYIFMNRQFEQLAQITLEQAKGKDDFVIFPQPIADLFRSQDEEVINRRKTIEFEETIPLQDGVHTFITAKFPIFDGKGNISAVGGFCTDITARKNAEAELKEAEEKYRSIFDYSPLGIMQIDKQGIVTVCNNKLAEILHTKAERIIGFDLLKSLDDEKVTIACHRQEIRKRLSLTNKKVNLQSALTIAANN